MTIKEARDYLNKIHTRYDDNPIIIPTQGLSCSGITATRLSLGIDWFNGCLCVEANPRPSQIDIHKHSKVCKLYLMEKKISNLKDIQGGKTLIARYKTLEKGCQRKSQAELWIWEQLDNELKSNE